MKIKTGNLIFKRVGKPLGDFMSQGLAPEMMSRTIAVGVFIGTIPIPGISTFLCAMLAVVFRMNLGLIQFINYLVFPLQLLLFIPYYGIASKITGIKIIEEIPLLLNNISGIPWQSTTVDIFWLLSITILVWIVLMFPVSMIIYFGLNPILLRINYRNSKER